MLSSCWWRYILLHLCCLHSPAVTSLAPPRQRPPQASTRLARHHPTCAEANWLTWLARWVPPREPSVTCTTEKPEQKSDEPAQRWTESRRLAQLDARSGTFTSVTSPVSVQSQSFCLKRESSKLLSKELWSRFWKLLHRCPSVSVIHLWPSSRTTSPVLLFCYLPVADESL